MEKKNWKEILKECVKVFFLTAVPAFISAISNINIFGEKDDVVTYLIATGFSIVVAGLTAVWESVLNPAISSVASKVAARKAKKLAKETDVNVENK